MKHLYYFNVSKRSSTPQYGFELTLKDGQIYWVLTKITWTIFLWKEPSFIDMNEIAGDIVWINYNKKTNYTLLNLSQQISNSHKKMDTYHIIPYWQYLESGKESLASLPTN